MKKFSWYTTEETTFDCVGQKFYRVCVDGEPIIGFYPYYKPNRKGGHTHNHIYNKCHKHIFRSKQARKNVDRKDKPEFVRIFHMNLELGNYSFDKLFAHDFSPQQKGK